MMKERDLITTAKIKQRWYERKRRKWRAKVGILSDKQIAEAEALRVEAARLQKEADDGNKSE